MDCPRGGKKLAFVERRPLVQWRFDCNSLQYCLTIGCFPFPGFFLLKKSTAKTANIVSEFCSS